jgi:DNA-directed RNA polymerase subunit N (RpoN/RPB10)
MQTLWPIIATIISAAAALVSGLVLFNLNRLNETIRTVSERVTSQNRDIGDVKDRLSVCRQDCDRSMVTKEDWIRSESYTRQKLDVIGSRLEQVSANMAIVDRLPQITAAVVREVMTVHKGG